MGLKVVETAARAGWAEPQQRERSDGDLGIQLEGVSKDAMVLVSCDRAGSCTEARWRGRDRRCENDEETDSNPRTRPRESEALRGGIDASNADCVTSTTSH